MITGLLTYLAAALFAEHLNGLCLPIGAERIPYGFFIFLMGSFLIGSSAAVLQTVIIPYVSAYELPHTQSVQRVNITCAVNSLGTTIAPFFVTGILFGGVSLTEIEAGQLQLPFLIIALCIVGIRYVISRLHLPDMAHTRMMKHEQQRMRRSIWSFRHLKWGVVAIFFYVGAEVAVGTNINLHAMETTNSEEALSLSALLATLYWSGMMIGRIVSGFLYNVSARTQLTVTTIIATLLILVGTATNNLWILVSVGLFHSVMWGSIFTLAVKGLKKYTSKASGLFMTGVFGGAVFPILQGIAADLSGSWQWTWLLIAVCELVMLGYALFGSRIRQADLEDID